MPEIKCEKSEGIMKKNYRELTEEELQTALHELQEENFTIRFQRKTQEIANPLRIRILRKEIARVKTILREKVQNKEK